MRRWTIRYVSGLKEELNKSNGLAAIGGFFFGFVSLATSGILQVALLVVGALIVLAAVGPAFINAIPEKIVEVKEYSGQEISLETYRGIDHRPPSIGIVGVEEVGKTVLKNYLLSDPQQEGTTQKITARITTTFEHPDIYVAVLDGPGDSTSQQFSIAREADILVVLLDHNIVAGQLTIAPVRIEQHKRFGRDIREQLQIKWAEKVPRYKLRVHLLLNKRDDWEKATPDNQAELLELLEDERILWRNLTFVDNEVTAAKHASTYTSDVSSLANLLKKDWSAMQQIEAGSQ